MKKLSWLFCSSMMAFSMHAQNVTPSTFESPYPGGGFDVVLRTGNTNCHSANAMPVPMLAPATGTAYYDLIAYTWDPGIVSAGNPYNWGIAFGEVLGGTLNSCFMNYAHYNVFNGTGTLSSHNAWCGSDVVLVKSDDGVNPKTYALVSYFDPAESCFKLDRLRFAQNPGQNIAEIDEVKTYVLDHVVAPNGVKPFTHIDAIQNEKFIITYTNPENHTLHFVTGNTTGGNWIIDQTNGSGVIESATLNYSDIFDIYPDVATTNLGGAEDMASYTCANKQQTQLYVFTNRYTDIATAGPGAFINPHDVVHYNGSGFGFPRIDCPELYSSPTGDPAWSVIVQSNYGDINAIMSDPSLGAPFFYTLNNGSITSAQAINSYENYSPAVGYDNDNSHVNFAWLSAAPSVNSPTSNKRFIGMQIDASANSVTPGYWDVSAFPANNSNAGGRPSVAFSSENNFTWGSLMTFNYTDNVSGFFDMYYKMVPWGNTSFRPSNNPGVKGIAAASSQTIGVAPNPFKQSFALQMTDMNADTQLGVSVMGIDGRLIKALHGNVQQINAQLNDFGQNLPAGAYVVKVRGTSIDQSIKLVKE